MLQPAHCYHSPRYVSTGQWTPQVAVPFQTFSLFASLCTNKPHHKYPVILCFYWPVPATMAMAKNMNDERKPDWDELKKVVAEKRTKAETDN